MHACHVYSYRAIVKVTHVKKHSVKFKFIILPRITVVRVTAGKQADTVLRKEHQPSFCRSFKNTTMLLPTRTKN